MIPTDYISWYPKEVAQVNHFLAHQILGYTRKKLVISGKFAARLLYETGRENIEK